MLKMSLDCSNDACTDNNDDSEASLSGEESDTEDQLSEIGGMTLDFSPKESLHQWTRLQSCEEFVGAKRSKHTMVAWNDRVYVFGGDNGKKMLNDFLVSHVTESSWARVVYTGQPPAPRYHHSAVVFHNSMFIFGGYTGDINSNSNLRNKNDLYEYCFTTSQWIDWSDKIIGPLPPARSAHGATVHGNKLWIFAGYDGNARLNDMWAIDLTNQNPQWEQINQLGDSPPTCCNFPVANVGDSMYVFSGQSGAKITNNLYEFKFKQKCWIRIPTEHLLRTDASPPQRRYGHSMVAYGLRLHVFGGAADGILDNEVHCFDVSSQCWSVIHPSQGSQVPSGRVFHTSAVCGNSMYIFGGTVDSVANRSGELYRFSFSSFPKCTLVDDFILLLENVSFSDVTFIIEDHSIQAHVAVVAARSPFLRSKILKIYETQNHSQTEAQLSEEFLPPFIPSEPIRVSLTGVSPETFNHALYFIYTDRVHPSLETYSIGKPVLLMMDLYKFSLLLEIKKLELLCIQYLESSVNEQNVLLILENASELHLSHLREYCLRFIVRESHYQKVIMSESFESLNRSLIIQIVRRQQFRSRPTSPEPSSIFVPSSLQDDLKKFLESDYGRPFGDIFLCVEDKKILAHKTILASRCSYFQALFRSFMPKNYKVQVSFAKTVPTLPAFNSLLRYIYSGEYRMPTEDALYVFSAPNFFGFSNLQLHAHCKASLEQNISVDNVVSLLKTSEFIDLKEMKDQCLSLITEHFPSLVCQPDFRDLNKELLLEVLETLAKSFGKNPPINC